MLRELSVSMIGPGIHKPGQQLIPALTNGPLQHSTDSLSREDSEEIEFECKLDQGLPGMYVQAIHVGGWLVVGRGGAAFSMGLDVSCGRSSFLLEIIFFPFCCI